jgi:Ca2+-binding EF-hand superfamily protein
MIRQTIAVMASALLLTATYLSGGPGGFGGTNGVCTNMVNLTGRPFDGPITQYDTDTNGTITSAELEAAAESMVANLQERFLERYDANADGSVTSEEALAVAEAHAEHWLTSLLARFDANDDGSISTNEVPRFGRHDGGSLFGLDSNADGVISGEELVAAAEASAAEQVERLLTRFDANDDGTISPEESLAVHQAMVEERIANVLERFDLDGDGNITSAEIGAVLQPRSRTRFSGHR